MRFSVSLSAHKELPSSATMVSPVILPEKVYSRVRTRPEAPPGAAETDPNTVPSGFTSMSIV